MLEVLCNFGRRITRGFLLKMVSAPPPPPTHLLQDAKSSVSTRLSRANRNLEQGHGLKASVPFIYQNFPWVPRSLMLLWNPESGIQLKESGIPQSDCNQESKYHWQGLESSFTTVLVSLTWDVLLINLMHPGSKNDVLKRLKWYNFERMMRQCISSLYDTVLDTSRLDWSWECMRSFKPIVLIVPNMSKDFSGIFFPIFPAHRTKMPAD